MGGSSSKKGQAATERAESTIVAEVDDLKDGEMKEVEVGENKALLVRDAGQYYAVSPKCTHFGAPLIKGTMCNGHIRCPWHGACFNFKTGDIEDFPGLDSLQKYPVEVEGGKVKIKATKTELSTTRRMQEMSCCSPDDERVFLIVGGGGASITCAETLRQEGFKGKIIITTKEVALPYDRTKLSKALDSKAEALAVRDKDFYSVYDIDIQLNKEATSVDPVLKSVSYKDGTTQSFDKLLIATGGSPRSLPIPGSDLENVFILRTPQDANRIAETAKGKHVVILGTSFIGMEVSASLAGKADTVTMLDIVDVPFKLVLGDQVGSAMKQLHEEKGTKFMVATSKEFVGENGRIKEVVLSDETRLPADVLIMGVGVFPTTAFLKDSGIDISDRGFVQVDKRMKTNKEDIYAAGDIVQFPLFINDDKPSNVQHWQMAMQHGRIAALNMLGKDKEVSSVPFFWTMQFGKSLRYTGYGEGYDDIVMHQGPEELKFIAYYTKGDKVIAVASMNSDPVAAQAAEMMLSNKTITKDEVKNDPEGWVKRLAAS